MGVGSAVRREFVDRFNEAFGVVNITETARRLQALPASADMFDMLDHLGLLGWVRPGELDAYRRDRNTMPPLSRHILTHTLHHVTGRAESAPTPMHLDIIHGPHEAIAAVTHDGQYYVTLTRTRYDR